MSRTVDALMEQALRYIEDALEGAEADEGYLLANDPDNVWCRLFAARSSLRVAVSMTSGRGLAGVENSHSEPGS